MKKIYSIFILSILGGQFAFAKKLARPDSLGGDYLVELNVGMVKEGGHEIYELGFEVERFLDNSQHHCAVGLSFEASDLSGSTKYFAGALTSLYYHHFKFFVSSGILFGEQDFKEWKTRYGLGREFFLKKDYIFIPALTLDRLQGETYPGFNLGFAREF